MTYATEQAALLADQLARLATGSAHQLAGQFANLAFWVDETLHALAVIDGYPRRFRALRDAHVAWVSSHHTTMDVLCPICGGACELGPRTPPAPTRISSEAMDDARRGLRRACYRLLLRCHRAGHLDEAALRDACSRIGVTLEREDLR